MSSTPKPGLPFLSAAAAVRQFRAQPTQRAAARGVVLGQVSSPIDAALARRTNQGRRTPDLFGTKG